MTRNSVRSGRPLRLNVIMRAIEFHAGAHWAYREKRALGTPASKVQLVMWVPTKPPSRKAPKVKSRHLDGDPTCMEEFVPPSRLFCPWKDWARLLKWERSELQLGESVGDKDLDKALIDAANAAFGAPLYADAEHPAPWRGRVFSLLGSP